MREIKFRAWDVETKEMYLVEEIRWKGEKMEGLMLVDGYSCWVDDIVNFVIMQYTGLKDKNGKEIYEGDILEFDAREWGTELSPIFQVSWNTPYAEWDFGGGGRQSDMRFRKVVGNTHENPELLK